MEPWRTRLQLLADQLADATAAIGEGKDDFSALKIFTDMFVAETRIYLEKMSQEEITRYTEIQVAACRLLSTKPHKSESSLRGDKNHSKLPKLELPKFNGDILKWTEFWDRFSSSIDNQRINDVDKLAYLISCLEQEALAAVEGLDTTSDNYKLAVDILKDRFGKPGIVIDAHYDAILNMKRATTSIECMTTYNELEKHLRILKSLGEDTNHNNLRKLMVMKYPDDLIYEIKTKVKIEEQSVDELRKLIEHTCTARISVNKPNFINTPMFSVSAAAKGRNKRKMDTNASVPDRKKKKLGCIFCDGDHYNDSCKTIRSVEDRKKKLNGRCYICFKVDHISRNCIVRKKCVYCKKSGHNRALCMTRDNKPPKKDSTFSGCLNKGTFLQTAITDIKSTDGKLYKCRVLLDTGSQRSYITKELFNKLKLDISDKDHLMVYTFGQEQPKKLESPRVKIKLSCTTGFEKEIEVNVVPFISHDVPNVDSRERHNRHQQLKLADDGSMGSRIDVLIGNDQYFNFVKEDRKQLKENFYLIETEFGWVCSGLLTPSSEQVLSFSTYVQAYTAEILGFTSPDLPIQDNHVAQLWELDSIGIKDDPKVTNEEEALRHFNESVLYKNGRYYVKWPWIQSPPQLPINYGLAYGRLASLIKRLDGEILESYENILKEQEASGIIEKVNNFNEKISHQVHYLPHHCVIKKENNTCKLRIVYDGSSKAKAELLSLNECMYKGTLLLEDLVGLLLRFRQHEIGITADIEKAFLQLSLFEEDRDVTRFLWVKDTKKEVTQDNLLCYRFCRVPFGVVSSPFLLNATIKYHLQKEDVADNLANKIYVDNLITGAENKEEAHKLYTSIYEAFQKISMNLRDWNSNDNKFLEEIPLHLKENKKVTKVLGLLWDTQEDTLQFKPQETSDTSFTKRKVLQVIASFYDPCGLVTPVLLPAKIFMQKLWKLKIKWDTVLSEDLQEEWNQIRHQLGSINDVKVPRYVGMRMAELHCFTDASNKAYAAAVYLKSTSDTHAILIMSKTKLTPLKDQDSLQIPRLELLGVLIGIRLLKYVRKNMEMNITKQHLWTDSQVVISWLSSDKLLPPFISRRVKEIRDAKDVQVGYVSSSQNPADIATRENIIAEKTKLWFEGPAFLTQQSSNANPEQTQIFCIPEDPSELNNTSVIDNTTSNNTREEEATEMNCDMNSIIKKEQERYYPQEIKGKTTDLSRSLGLFKDENGLLRCKGRVALAEMSYDRKYPILLPKDAEVNEKIIKKIHKDNYHVGTSHTLCLLRERYWLPQGRSRVQKILNKCFECKRFGGGPYRLPHMPDLPAERVNYSSPFTFTGLDYLGPLLVTNDKGITEKRWICLYTCLAVRAIHLEVVNDLSAEECSLAVRRFTAVRGMPQLFLSDNATQFKLTAEVMTGPYCIENKIQWKFIPELAPWHGGLYERLVALVKHCIKRTVDISQLRDNQFSTIIKEIESILNTRPLTYVGSEPEHVLTPMDFLRIESCITEPSEEPYLNLSDTNAKRMLIEGWKRGQRILKEFQKMFINQYLTTLRERKDVKHRQPRVLSSRSPKVGDVVQIKGDTDNRLLWKMGTIVELHKGLDNEIRVATVKSQDKTYRRSIAHLYPLEVEEQQEETEVTEDIPTDTRRGRTAAQKARAKISEWTRELVQTIFTLE